MQFDYECRKCEWKETVSIRPTVCPKCKQPAYRVYNNSVSAYIPNPVSEARKNRGRGI